MNPVRPLRKIVFLPDWLWNCLFVLVVAGSIVTESIWFFISLIIVVLAQGIYLFVFARCPTCRGKFTFHRGELSRSSTKYRLQLKCRRCHMIWDTGRIRDDDVFFNS